MKRILTIALCALLLVTTGCAWRKPKAETPEQAPLPTSAGAYTPAPQNAPAPLAVYLGVEGYGALDASQKDSFRYRFFVDGTTVTYSIAPDGGAYAVQNLLEEGGVYALATEGDVIVGAQEAVGVSGADAGAERLWRIERLPGGAAVTASTLQAGETAAVYTDPATGGAYLGAPSSPYAPPVTGTPGVRTLKNLLQTAMMPVGTTLYVYGGGWNWQDTAASRQARSIGVPQQWVEFFRQQDAGYSYKAADAAHSYYPFGGWNEYYYAGADCSGYVGWTLYNTFETTNGAEGYVWYACDVSQKLAELGLGTQAAAQTVQPGDIMSMEGHVWIALGSCSDGSIVIAHSTPEGGAQLSAVGASAACEAYRLAQDYMTRYFPDWAARYPVVLRSPGSYLSAVGGSGLFRWNTQSPSGLSDPDGLQQLQADAVLRALFGEK